MKRRFLALLCVVSLMCVCATPSVTQVVADSSTYNQASIESFADSLHMLGLLQGYCDSLQDVADYKLESRLTAAEALVMSIRMLGLEDEARSSLGTHSFVNMPDWAASYVGYTVDKGIIEWPSIVFEQDTYTVTSKDYLASMLQALGYSVGNNMDFLWDNPLALARYVGIVPDRLNDGAITRSDMVAVTCATLFADIKGGTMTLYEKLIADGIFTDELFSQAFTGNPFVELKNNGFTQVSRIKHTDYARAMGSLNEHIRISETVETSDCTIVLGEFVGVPHKAGVFCVVYKSGSVVGEGMIVELPMARESMMEGGSTPGTFDVKVNNTITYKYSFNEFLVSDLPTGNTRVLREAGDFRFTVDLDTGTVTVAV